MNTEVADLGPDSTDSMDYPDYGYKLASVIADGTATRGVALCGQGHRHRSEGTAAFDDVGAGLGEGEHDRDAARIRRGPGDDTGRPGRCGSRARCLPG